MSLVRPFCLALLAVCLAAQGLECAGASELDIIARVNIVKDSSGNIALQIAPNRSFALTPNELSKGLEALANTSVLATVRGQLYKKLAGRKKAETSEPLKLLILEDQKKE